MSSSIDAQVLGIFRSQAGVITAAQAIAQGFTPRQIRYRLQRGRWSKIRRGVYRHALFEESDLMWMHAIAATGSGFASHRYAAKLHGLEPYDNAKPEFTVERGSLQHLPKTIRVHESTQTETAEVETIDGLPVSGVERTIMDLAATEHRQWPVLAAMDSAIRLKKTDRSQLNNCLEIHARRGRDGTVKFRSALAELAQSESTPIGHASRRAAAILTAGGIISPSFEDQVFVGGEFVAQADLAWDVPLVAFIDGFTFHGSRRRQVERDHRQRQTLRSSGLAVLEFTYDQLSDPGFVVSTTRVEFRNAAVRLRREPDRFGLWASQRSLP